MSHKQSAGPDQFDPVGAEGFPNNWGFANFETHSTLFNSLVDGTLVIEPRMRLAKPTKSVCPLSFVSENLFAKNFGVISFVVGGQQKNYHDGVIVQPTPAVFHAHQYILRKCSIGILADICDLQVSEGVSTLSPVEITDVSPEAFQLLLHSAYGFQSCKVRRPSMLQAGMALSI